MEWRKLNGEILRDLHSSSVLIIQKNVMAGYVARNGSEDEHRGLWWEKVTDRVHLENLGLMGKIILMYIFKKQDGRAWMGWPFSW